jgi:glycosyltransferase involved in cell wall biosynthesis
MMAVPVPLPNSTGNLMSVAVVIPAYNSAGFITETLDTVFCQTLKPDEVLVIDDGSTDGTGEIAKAFDPFVRVVRTENSGLSATRNVGTRESTSEWIAFLDADDLWEPEKLEIQMAALARNPQADICYTARREFTQDGGVKRLGKVVKAAPAVHIREALFRNTNFLSSSVVIRRATLIEIGGFSPHTKVEDWDLWLRLFHAGFQFVDCQEPLMLYRIHTGGLSHKAVALLEGKEEIYQRLVLPHLPPRTRWLRLNRQRSEHESCAAFALRGVGDPRCLATMAKSILRQPFYEPHRYKVLAHMLYTRLRGVMGAPVRRTKV